MVDQSKGKVIMKHLQPGDKIHNGSIVIHYTHERDREPGGYASGVVLCIDMSTGMAYAVWTVYYLHDGYGENKWSASNGGYFEAHELDKAYARYQERAGLG